MLRLITQTIMKKWIIYNKLKIINLNKIKIKIAIIKEMKTAHHNNNNLKQSIKRKINKIAIIIIMSRKFEIIKIIIIIIVINITMNTWMINKK